MKDNDYKDTKKRARIAFSDTPSGYRIINHKIPAPPGVKMELDLFQFTATRSLKKCSANCRNQERIYTEGDTVGIITNFDPFTYKGEVWFVVSKAKKQNQRRLWKRSWPEIQENIGETLSSIDTECFDVCELGRASIVARNGRMGPTKEASCLSIRIDKGIFLWVEVGMFKIITSPQNFDFTKLCYDYSDLQESALTNIEIRHTKLTIERNNESDGKTKDCSKKEPEKFGEQTSIEGKVLEIKH